MTHIFRIRELLNITTGIQHTKMEDVYSFFDKVIAPGIPTHMIPKAFAAIRPILKEKLLLPFDGHHPEIRNQLVTFHFTEEDKTRFWKNINLDID